jgi:hypothetical protein
MQIEPFRAPPGAEQAPHPLGLPARSGAEPTVGLSMSEALARRSMPRRRRGGE